MGVEVQPQRFFRFADDLLLELILRLCVGEALHQGEVRHVGVTPRVWPVGGVGNHESLHEGPFDPGPLEHPRLVDQFVSLYSQAYDQVKAASPGTRVFTIFQLEKMNRLDGGLYGGINNATQAEWQLLSLFPKDDVAAFTTYPSLVYQAPADVPADYHSSIAMHTNLSVGFTEVGWHAGHVAGGWASNESEQANFMARFFSATAPLSRSFVVWSFLYDPNAAVPFNTMGLFYANGTAKLGWQTWLLTT